MPGYEVQVLDEAGNRVAERATSGRHRHQATVASGQRCRRCGTRISGSSRATCRPSPATTTPRTPAIIDEDGYIHIMARTDDVINVAGHRLSTGGMEEVLAGHPDVGRVRGDRRFADQLKGRTAAGVRLCLNAGCNRSARRDRGKECIQRVRDEIGPVAAFKLAVVIDRLPKTRSGKILRANHG